MSSYGSSLEFIGRCLQHSYGNVLRDVDNKDLSFVILEMITYILRLPEISGCLGRTNEEGELIIACDMVVDLFRKKLTHMATMPDYVLRGVMVRVINKLCNTECGPATEGMYVVSVIDLDHLQMRLNRERAVTHGFMVKCNQRETIREIREVVRSEIVERQEEKPPCVCARCRMLREEESST
jgi:hypothetical protein